MTELAILVPVLARPHRVGPLLDSIEATCTARVLFIADPHDSPEIAVLEEFDAEFITFAGNYAAKIAEGIQETNEPLLFLGADDLKFYKGWLEAAVAKLNGAQVVGVNDLIKRDRDHATHFLVTREYAETPTIDGGPGPLHRGYSSWYVDDELIATARKRGVYAYAEDAVVEHLHHMNGKAPDDETYRLGRSRWRQDRRLFQQRQALWT